MHFVAEAANHNTKPTQCYICLQYNHIAKYCNTKEQVCARCGEKHNVDKCNAASDACKCNNCEGNHLATSNECPAYKEQEKRLVNAVNKYSSKAVSTNGQSACNINSINDFPSLPSTSQQPFNWTQNDMFDELIKIISSKMEKMIEETTTRLFSSLQKRLKKIEKIVQQVENDNESGHIVSSSESSSEDENSKKPKILVTTVAQAKALAEKYHRRVSSLPPTNERTTTASKITTTTQPKTTKTNEASSSKTNSKTKEAKPKHKRNRSPNSSFEATATINKGQKTSGNEN